MPARRAMTSEHASEVKTGGHLNEHHFADIIGGEVQLGSPTDKKDVIDVRHNAHSVKSGAWWQIFLYGRERFLTNTILQGLGDISEIMVACIDALPGQYDDYRAGKDTAKRRLQPQMRRLRDELLKPNLFRAFLDKSLFNGGEATHLSVYLGPSSAKSVSKVFHIFHKDDVISAFASDIEIRNSKARTAGQYDDQKVILYSRHLSRNLGEIELRADSPVHYRQMKCRLNANSVITVLQHHIKSSQSLHPQVIVHGKAIRTFRMPKPVP